MSTPFFPIETADLSWHEGQPFSNQYNDIYFSTDDGLAEAQYVFLEANHLAERWQNLDNDSFVIGETGFGTGLNFLLAWSQWLEIAPSSATLHFISCEKFPLKIEDLSRCLARWPQLSLQAEALINNYPVLTPGFHHLIFEDGRVRLTLMLGDASACFKQLELCGDVLLEEKLRRVHVDAWFLDGFSPAKNQAMWSKELFHSLALLSKTGTSLTSFTVAGEVRKNLAAVGFKIQKVKGFGRKRHMTFACFEGPNAQQLLKKRHTPWHVSEIPNRTSRQAIVIGAGLAGCYSAYALATRGWSVILIDGQKEAGLGASANEQAVLYPTLSAYNSPFTDFMLTSYLYALRIYSKLIQNQSIEGQLSGILQLAFNAKENAAQASLTNWLAAYPQLGQLLSNKEISEYAGINLESAGLLLPQSGWLNSPALCKFLIQRPGVHWVGDTFIDELKFIKGQWQAGDYCSAVLVLANGYQAKQFSQTAHLPLKPIRGQMTTIRANEQSEKLKIPLCAEGHVLPAKNKLHLIGASYHLGSTDKTCYQDDDLENLARLRELSPNYPWSDEIKASWTGIRATTPDYLPMVGAVPNEGVFQEHFSALATNSKRWIPMPGSYYPGLYICAGFGSKGLTTIPLSAEWLASSINNEFPAIPRKMIESLSAARFIRKKIVKNLK